MLRAYKWNDALLRKWWKTLYDKNLYLFPYSSREYNEKIYAYMQFKPNTIFQKNEFLVFFADSNKGKPLLIAPIFKKMIRYIYLVITSVEPGI